MSRRDAALITTFDLGMDGDDCALLEDPPAPERVIHSMADILRFRMLMIAASYEDVNDADNLRHNPAFKLTLGRLSVAAALCSQLTISRFENLPGPRELLRMGHGANGHGRRSMRRSSKPKERRNCRMTSSPTQSASTPRHSAVDGTD